jgi:hypothetical protein
VVNNDKSKPPKRRQLTHSRIELVADSEWTLAGIRGEVFYRTPRVGD